MYDRRTWIAALVVMLLAGAGCVASIGNRSVPKQTPSGTEGNYRIETVPLASGGWDLLKYRPDTGEAWYSRGETWVPIVDLEEVPRSSYVFEPAPDGDRGWSVIRLDTRSGRTWITNNSTWVEVQEPPDESL